MGKSRNAAEIAKYMAVIPVVLRPATDTTGFPRADEAVRDYLVVSVGKTESQQLYQKKFRIFLRLVFLFVGVWLHMHTPPPPPPEYEHVAKHWAFLYRVTAWRLFLVSKRDEAYSIIIEEAKKYATSPSINDAGSTVTMTSTLSTFIRILKGVALQPTPAWDPSLVPDFFKAQMSDADLAKVFLETNEFDVRSTDLLVLLSFDEAQDLTQPNLHYTLPGAVSPVASDDPISSPLRAKSAYDMILSVLNDVRAQAMGLFLSTSTKIGQFAPPAALASSARQTKSKRLQAPITELPFDCYVTDEPLPLVGLKDEGLSSISFLARFGRPLWNSLLVKAGDMSPEDRQIRERDLLALACAKLAGTNLFESFSKTKSCRPDAEKAVVDVRICVQFNQRKSSALDSIESELVAGHLRIAYSVPEHRIYFHSGYSSEPIVAEAAAIIMAHWMPGHDVQDAHQRESCWNPLDTLVEMMNNNLIAFGERGELVARLLLTLAYDIAMRLTYPMRDLGTPELPFSRGCGFLDFIRALFGSENAEHLLSSTPDNFPSTTKLSEAFAKARVRFTHFVRLGDGSGLTTVALCAAYIRGMAFIGKTNQTRVDFMLPILRDPDAPICPGNMTVLLIQVKRRTRPCKPNETDYTAEQLHVFDDSDNLADDVDPIPDAMRRDRPYCLLLMELMAPMPAGLRDSVPPLSSPSSPPHTGSGLHLPTPKARTSARNNPPHPRYNIKAYGCSHTVYSDIIEKDNNGSWGRAKYDLLLAKRSPFDEHPRKTLLKYVWQMKPQWVSNALHNSYNWIKAAPKEPAAPTDEPSYGVRAVPYKKK
ncbi:hypothetical protein AURDEDRAFT_169837 [Auricularia subglabra TFB-10046 SS5]|nr:hypothetical protein AURDEDRAFT_169837 [Auricularia subglabra TFB-10046 SS5]